jgi:hypothetical protein
VHKVEIFPSLYGLERMKNDTMYGPPKEIFDPEGDRDAEFAQKKRKHNKKKKYQESSDDEEDVMKAAGFENEDDDLDAFNQEKLREYEVQKMKYYYAVVHCNNSKTAKFLYDEYNGFEFENSNIRLNMSFIPDELEFT